MDICNRSYDALSAFKEAFSEEGERSRGAEGRVGEVAPAPATSLTGRNAQGKQLRRSTTVK